MKTKICTKCGIKFPATTDYFYMGSGKFGLRAICRRCYTKQYWKGREKELEHREECKKLNIKICTNCKKELPVTIEFFPPETRLKCGLHFRCRDCRKEYDKQHYPNRREQMLKNKKEYGRTNRGKEVIKKALKKYRKKNKLSCRIANLIRHSLKGNKEDQHWETLVSYTLEELKQHLEGLFQPGMTWENHTTDGWHIDHKIPISSFNITSYDCKEFKGDLK